MNTQNNLLGILTGKLIDARTFICFIYYAEIFRHNYII